MRKILFRAKQHFDGEWVYGLVTMISERGGWCMMRPTGGDRIVECELSTLGQYTGLTDENGREIFEGDICKDGDNVVRILWSDKHQWGVEISKTDSVLSKGLVFPLWQYDDCKENGYRTLEVIGNIFDNPELIGG